jgi:hypothetical protein
VLQQAERAASAAKASVRLRCISKHRPIRADLTREPRHQSEQVVTPESSAQKPLGQLPEQQSASLKQGSQFSTQQVAVLLLLWVLHIVNPPQQSVWVAQG